MDNGIRTICILIICLRILRRVMLLSIQERPANHGIVVGGLAEREMYCTDDAWVLYGTKEEGEMSPKNLLRLMNWEWEPTLGRSLAWVLKIVVILPAGFCQLGILVQQNWFFYFSSFMARSLRLGSEIQWWKALYAYINKGWDLKPKVLYNESLEDNNPYEGNCTIVAPVFLMI
jgi:hypothetical protein